MRRDALLAIGLLLTTATQLRIGGAPVGPGELCLSLWLVSMVANWYDPPRSPALLRLALFWALFALAQTIGMLAGLAISDIRDVGLVVHDVIAYALAAMLGCTFVVGPGAGARLRRVASLLVIIGAAMMLPQLMAAWGAIDLPLIEPWFGDRFRGWSNNPNQLGFLCVVLLLLSMYLADAAERPGERAAPLACALIFIALGRLTKTDTFTFAMMVAVPIFLACKLRFWLIDTGQQLTLRHASALIAVIAVPAILAAAVPVALPSVDDPLSLAKSFAKNDGKEADREAALRLELWGEAIGRGLDAAALGLGPGPHLPIPPTLVVARQSDPELDTGDHPSAGEAPNFEAHNTPLDLFAQGGVLAVASFGWIVAVAFVAAWRARQAGLIALLCGLTLFGMTNLIVRPPLFWFVLALALVAKPPVPLAERLRGRFGAAVRTGR